MLLIPDTFKSSVRKRRSLHYATCWKIRQITGTGGSTFRFTDWPEPLRLAEEEGTVETYTPTDSLEGSAVRRSADGDSNREARGIVSSTAISVEDLTARRFDNAEVTEYLVDTRLAWKGYIDKLVYYIRETRYDKGVWRAECLGLADVADEQVGEFYGPDCRVDVFSQGPGKCNANPSLYTASTSVASVSVPRLTFRANMTISHPSMTALLAAGVFKDGRILWTGGANIGLYSDIKLQVVTVSPSCDITLQQRTPLPIAVSDTFSATTGCNKQAGIFSADGHCKNLYNNLVNIQGEPFIPGRDAAERGLPTL